MEQKMTSNTPSTNSPGQHEHDEKRAPSMPQQNDNAGKDADAKEGKPQDEGKNQQK